MKKRGQITIQFNWIFVLIAGAVILLFFGSIITWQRNVATERTSTIVVTNLDAIITGARLATDTVKVNALPRGDVRIDCNTYRIGNAARFTKDRPIFAPCSPGHPFAQ